MGLVLGSVQSIFGRTLDGMAMLINSENCPISNLPATFLSFVLCVGVSEIIKVIRSVL